MKDKIGAPEAELQNV